MQSEATRPFLIREDVKLINKYTLNFIFND
jgi:hypothetical protein